MSSLSTGWATGPSASGKTTFSKRLSIQVLGHGLRPFPLAMDDYFLDRERTPRDELGELDYEALGALDLARLNDDLKRLTAGEPVEMDDWIELGLVVHADR